jgi:stage II sporulation protein D
MAALVAPATLTPVGVAAYADELGPAAIVRFEAADGDQLQLHGRGRFAGALELRADDPAIVVNELGLEDYLAGIDEMPSRWHPEALRAQAIAARTYAWYSIGQDSFDGYDVCATTACQVYRGIGATLDADRGDAWLEAVADTAGQVLLHEDRPILARYFSTSGGHTVANEVAFPSSGPRPYLVGVEDPYDAASPYHRWTATFTRDEFDTILGRGDSLSAVVPIAELTRVGDVDDPGATIRVTGQDGHAVEVGAREFREFVSRVAPDSFPDRFPGRRADGLRGLPSTVPSSRFDPEVTDDEVVLHGRGFGHAVGLGQYGANARARDGQDHPEILAANNPV